MHLNQIENIQNKKMSNDSKRMKHDATGGSIGGDTLVSNALDASSNIGGGIEKPSGMFAPPTSSTLNKSLLSVFQKGYEKGFEDGLLNIGNQ